MDRIFIIDAVNFLFRSYYAIGPMTNDHGQSTSALFGFIRSLQKLFKDFSPNYAVCVFDGPDNKKSRKAIYSEYKMHRKGAPEDLFPQFEWAFDYCDYAGIPHISVEGVEADDTMATIAKWASEKGAEVYLCSSDKDLMQLIDNRTFMLQPQKNNLLVDAQKVEELYGVRPDQMLDLLAIMGDSSDNIPGLEGFGPKTAAALLKEFETLDYILAHPEKIKGEKKQETIKKGKDVALMSRELATLNLAVEIPKSEDFYQLGLPHHEKLADFYHEMKFLSLLRELGVEKPSKPLGKRHTDKHQYAVVDTEAQLKELFHKLNHEKEVCIDTETNGVSPLLANMVGIGFSVEPGEAWYVPCNGHLGAKKVEEALAAFFDSTDCSFYGHNIKYDCHILKNLGIDLQNICFDTLLASYLLNPQSRRHNLDELALETFKKIKIPLEELIGKGKNQCTLFDVPIEKVKDYCCEDADYTCRLKEHFEEELEEKKLKKLFSDIELPLVPILASMERTGIYLDPQPLGEVNQSLKAEIQKIKERIFSEVGVEFNLNSPKQLGEILYTKLGLKPPGRKTTEFSTGAEVLEELRDESPVVQQILDYRALEKLRSTYAEALPGFLNPNTKRIHCTFNQSGTATGRLACQDPNLQNIPVRSKAGLDIRACFKPQQRGWRFLGADYSQIELRILAHFSEDPELLKAFTRKEDVHAHTASLVFNVPVKEVTPQMRDQAKTVNFGILYGQGPFGLSKQLGISMSQASAFIKTYFERYPGVSEYFEHCKAVARKKGIAQTLTGRQRPIPEIHNKNPSIRSAAERLAINTPLQGTAADLIKMAMISIDREIHERNLEGKMILQIHDELIFEIPEHEIEVFESIVKEKMETVFPLNVPLEVHMSIGKNWAEC